MLADVQKRLDDKQIKLTLTEKAKEFIVENGFDPNFGARPLKRYIQRKVETMLARKIIADDVAPNTELTIDEVDNDLKFV